MKIVYLTAGAAGMYCGSCLHDNALAKQLIRLGQDCLLVPVYTPIRTDDEDVSIDRVFMGGINVFLQQRLPWLAYLPRWADQVLNQPWLIRSLTKNVGKTSPTFLGALTVSMLKGTAGNQRKEFSRLLQWLENDIHPDVVVLTNLLIGGGIPDIKRRCGSRVFVTLQGDDIFIESLPEPFRKQTIELLRSLVPTVDGFLLHSHDYADRMKALLAIPSAKVHVIPLGIPTEDFVLPDRNEIGGKYRIGYFARMAPEKGLHRLVDAFIEVARTPGFEQLEEFWIEQTNKLASSGLDGRWEYCGSIDRRDKATFLNELDLFCVPTVYTEPKGLFLLEAVACGVPYLQPRHGAFPEIHDRLASSVPEIPMGRLFEADSHESLVNGIKEAVRIGPRRFVPSEPLRTEISIERHAQRVLELLRN
jgi:glycosyltransferase involved in cell wall biosynthesis